MNYTRDNRLPTPGPTPAVGGSTTPAGVILGGGGWIRTTEARASDLQSDPFGHSGTPPEGRTFSRCQGRVSTLNFTLKIPLYACICPRFGKCVRDVVIFAPGSPRRLGSGGLKIISPPRHRNTTQPGASSGCKRCQRKNVSRKNGAGERNRPPDRLITNQLLYLLSYASQIQTGACCSCPI